MEILDTQLADRDGHPAILSAMIVNAAGLADFPADGHDFKEFAFIDQISSVMAFGIEKVWFDGLTLNGMLLQVMLDIFERELLVMDFREALNPIVNGQWRHDGINGSIAPASAVRSEKNGWFA